MNKHTYKQTLVQTNEYTWLAWGNKQTSGWGQTKAKRKSPNASRQKTGFL